MRKGGPLACQKKHDLSTGGKDSHVNTGAHVKQSSLNPGNGVGNTRLNIWEVLLNKLCDSNEPHHGWEQTMAHSSPSPGSPQPGLGGPREHPAMALPGQNEEHGCQFWHRSQKVPWRYKTGRPELQGTFRVVKTKTSRSGCPQQAEIWVAAQIPLTFNSHQQMPQQNSVCTSDFVCFPFLRRTKGKCCNLENHGEMELLLPRKSRLGTGRSWSGIREAKQECGSILLGITVILYCSFWT